MFANAACGVSSNNVAHTAAIFFMLGMIVSFLALRLLCALDFGEQMGSGLLLRLLPQAMQSHRDEHHGGFLTLFRFDVHS